MRALLFSVALSLLGLPLAARANTITAGAYTLQDAFVSGYSVTGTVTFNASGGVTAADLTFNDPNASNSGYTTFNQVSSTNVYNGLSQNYLTNSANSGQLALYLNTTTDANGWFDLCLGSAQCGTSTGTVDPSALQIYGFYNGLTNTSNPGVAATNFRSGYLTAGVSTASAVTPEPSTIALMGTGLVGLASAAASRSFRRSAAAGDAV